MVAVADWDSMSLAMPPSPDLDALSVSELKRLVETLLAEVARLKETVAGQRDEIARLKGLKRPPRLPPPVASGMEQASERGVAELGVRAQPLPRHKGGGGAKTAKLGIHEERVIRVAGVPQGRASKATRALSCRISRCSRGSSGCDGNAGCALMAAP